MMTIPLTKGYVAVVDDADYDRVAAFKWHALVGRRTVYAARSVQVNGSKANRVRRYVYLHRFVLDAPPGLEVDHRDGNGLDCRRSNLRLCTRAENSANTVTKRRAGGFKGIYFERRWAKWNAQITADGKKRFVGQYATADEAARAYDHAAVQAFGAFARLNFPVGGA